MEWLDSTTLNAFTTQITSVITKIAPAGFTVMGLMFGVKAVKSVLSKFI